MAIVNLVILGDERLTWRPDPFRVSQWVCEVDFRFPIVKLLDHPLPDEWDGSHSTCSGRIFRWWAIAQLQEF